MPADQTNTNATFKQHLLELLNADVGGDFHMPWAEWREV